jgi:hypothetical protein
VGIEPTTTWLKATRSTTELRRLVAEVSCFLLYNQYLMILPISISPCVTIITLAIVCGASLTLHMRKQLK